MNLLKSAATGLLLALTTLVCAAPAAAQTVEYVHTDALGSVVAVTDANRNIVERREYEPYGYQLTPTLQNGPGYTGHVQDASTGLTYMQQRYYDPLLGRFLSVDPVTMHDNGDPRLFNRYAYAANNPYTFVDPDGRIFGVLGKVVKLAIKGGDVAATVAGAVEDAGVLFGSDATASERLAAAASLATEVLSPVSARDAKAGVNAVRDWNRGAKGASGELTTARGTTYPGNSTGSSATGGDPRAPMHPDVQEALDAVQNPSRTHGHCCEIDAMNKAKNAGEDLNGASMGPVTLNEDGRQIPPCSTCREVKKSLGVN